MIEKPVIAGSIFLVALITVMLLQWKLGLHDTEGVRHQNRNSYSLVLGALFAVGLVVALGPDVGALMKSLAFALVLAGIWVWRIRVYYKRKIIDGVLVLPKSWLKRNLIITAVVFIGATVLLRIPLGGVLLDEAWPLLGLSLSWPISTVYACYQVRTKERQLGHPILEQVST